MRYKYIIFDFDGTLFDSRIGIVDSVLYALDYLKIEHPSAAVLTSFIGPPLSESFKKHLGLSDADTNIAVAKLREHYSEKGYLLAKPYEGVLELIKALHKRHKYVGIATAKPTVYAKQILRENSWLSYFHSVHGSELKGAHAPKEKTIGQVMQDFNVFGPGEFVMVGDTLYDIKGAQERNIASIAVDYGYGKTQDLKDARPNYLVETVEKLQEILLA